MLEVLSTIGLTASALLVIGFLAYAMAETPRGRLTVAGVLTAWFARHEPIGYMRSGNMRSPGQHAQACGAARPLPAWAAV